MATSRERTYEAESKYYLSLKAGLIAHISGQPPVMSVEFACEALFSEARPTFGEVEAATADPPAAA
jgi:chemotaxis protein MotA